MEELSAIDAKSPPLVDNDPRVIDWFLQQLELQSLETASQLLALQYQQQQEPDVDRKTTVSTRTCLQHLVARTAQSIQSSQKEQQQPPPQQQPQNS